MPARQERKRTGSHMALNGAQIRQLRSMANGLNPAVTVGKSNVDDGVVARAVESLEAHELVKCSVLGACELDVKEAARQLAMRTNADLVQVIGRKFVLYRASHRRDIEQIELV